MILSALPFIGSLLLAAFSFFIGRVYSETQTIMAEKRKQYLEFLSLLPPLQDTYNDMTEQELMTRLEPAIINLPSLMFYADTSVLAAWEVFHEKYLEAHEQLTPHSPPLAPPYQALSKAQNDLILEMRRDSFRGSIFSYRGKSRVPPHGSLRK